MELSLTNSAIWEEIERSESYLVCCMFEEATSLASSVLQRICKANITASMEDVQLADMMESAGMVLVQSLKELGRTSEILNELKILFGSVTAVPIQVLLAGSCFLISDGSYSDLRKFLEEFLGKWRFMEHHQCYALAGAEPNGAYLKGVDGHCILETEKYLEVVEVYAVTLLGKALNDTDHAIAWVEQAELPEEHRQELSRRLHSLYSVKGTKSSHDVETPMLADKYETHTNSGKGRTVSGGDTSKQTILKLNERVEPCFWWFRTVTLKFGNARLVISHGKMVFWGSFIFFVYYLLQKKQATLKRIVGRQALSVKKALLDMWQLAFAVQVNPLAAVESLTSTSQGSR